ncbi:MAG: Fic family protein [Acholeplasma sp.]|nr:Fic family protein [Acholeplasma sp.]
MGKDLLEMHKKNFENLLHDKKITNCHLNSDFVVTYTYDAISTEGKNKIPFEGVKSLIANGKIGNYSEREQKEVLNHVACFEKIVKLSESKKDITEEQLKDLHELLMRDILIGGVYRNVNIQILGATHQPPDYVKVYDRMKKLFDVVATSELDDLDKGIYIHAQIAKIHPFLDGNGRLARLTLNYYLIKAGYIPITIPLDLRDEYFKNIEIFKVEKNIKPLTDFIKDLINKRYELLIDELEV